MESLRVVEYRHYRFDHLATGCALDGTMSSRILLIPKHSDNCQRWQFLDDGRGGLAIRNLESGNVLQDERGKLRAERPSGDAAQRWRVEDAGDGLVKIVNVGTGQVLDGNFGDTYTLPWNGSSSQKWSLSTDPDPAVQEVLKTFDSCCGSTQASRKRWERKRHDGVVDRAVQLLEVVLPGAGVQFMRLWSQPAFKDEVKRGLLDADYIEPYKGFYWDSHFYDPDTKTNYLGASSPTAMTETLRHFHVSTYARRLVVDPATGVDSPEALRTTGYVLGLALHYATDLGQPMHAANFTNLAISVRDLRHQGFEDYADRQGDRFDAQVPHRRPDDRMLADFATLDYDDVTGIIETLAVRAKKIFRDKVRPALWEKVTWSGREVTSNTWGSEADAALAEAVPYLEIATAAFLHNWIASDVVHVVERVYRRLLKREPDRDGLLVYRRHMIDDRWTIQRMVEEIGASGEYFNNFVSKRKSTDELLGLVVDDFFARPVGPHEKLRDDLRQTPDHNRWRTIVSGLVRSEEYVRRFGEYRVPDARFK